MPIRMTLDIKVEGRDMLRVPFPDIQPGTNASMTDILPSGDEGLVIVACADDDEGGAVLRQSMDRGEAVLGGAFMSVDMTGSDVEVVINEGDRYERDIKTKHGMGKLAMRHYRR